MSKECATARAPSTASGEQQALVPSVSGSAQSFTVIAMTSTPRSRSRSAATAESTPPDTATATRSGAGMRSETQTLGSSGRSEAAAALRARWRASVESWAAWRLAGARPPRRASVSSIDIEAASRTVAPSIVSARAAVAARVAPQPSVSKVTVAMRPRAMVRERRETSPQAAPPAAPVKASSGVGPRRESSRRKWSKSSRSMVRRVRREDLGEVGGHLVGRVVDVIPGDAGGGVALGGEDAVSFTVIVEGIDRPVRPAPVELDRHPHVLPEAVDLIEAPADRQVRVHPRPRQAEAVHQRKERLLQLVPGDPDGKRPAISKPSEQHGAFGSRIAPDQIRHRQPQPIPVHLH